MSGCESVKATVQYINLAGERVRRLVQLSSLISSLAQEIPGQNPIPVLLTLQIMRGGSSSFDSFYGASGASGASRWYQVEVPQASKLVCAAFCA